MQRLSSKRPTGPQLLVGDFNLHHPLWDRAGRLTLEAGTLLTLAKRWDLTLLTL